MAESKKLNFTLLISPPLATLLVRVFCPRVWSNFEVLMMCVYCVYLSLKGSWVILSVFCFFLHFHGIPTLPKSLLEPPDMAFWHAMTWLLQSCLQDEGAAEAMSPSLFSWTAANSHFVVFCPCTIVIIIIPRIPDSDILYFEPQTWWGACFANWRDVGRLLS